MLTNLPLNQQPHIARYREDWARAQAGAARGITSSGPNTPHWASPVLLSNADNKCAPVLSARGHPWEVQVRKPERESIARPTSTQSSVQFELRHLLKSDRPTGGGTESGI